MLVQKYFINPFKYEKIGREKKLLFTTKVISGIDAVNPGGIYTANRTAIDNKFTLYRDAVAKTNIGAQVSATATLDEVEQSISKGLNRLYVRVQDKYPDNDTKLKLFFPQHKASINDLKRGDTYTFLLSIQTKVNADVDMLGTDMQTLINDLIAAWDLAQNNQGQAISSRNDAATDVNQVLWDDVADVLFDFMIDLCKNNKNNPDVCSTYFDESLIYTHHQNTFNLSILKDDNESIKRHLKAGGSFTVTLPDGGNVRIFLATAEGLFQGNMQEVNGVNPTQIFNDNFGVDLDTHLYVVVVNLSSTAAVNVKIEF